MARRRDRGYERVAELDRVAVGECDVRERHTGIGGQVGGRAGALNQRR
jgi:hypothetical protein